MSLEELTKGSLRHTQQVWDSREHGRRTAAAAPFNERFLDDDMFPVSGFGEDADLWSPKPL